MYYNKDNPQWHFNQEQYLSQEEYDLIVGESIDLVKTMQQNDTKIRNTPIPLKPNTEKFKSRRK